MVYDQNTELTDYVNQEQHPKLTLRQVWQRRLARLIQLTGTDVVERLDGGCFKVRLREGRNAICDRYGRVIEVTLVVDHETETIRAARGCSLEANAIQVNKALKLRLQR